MPLTQKSKQQLCIKKVDANSRRGELAPLGQQQNAELKLSGSNEKEDDSNKPHSREKKEEHRFAKRRRSRRQETEERLQRLQTYTDSCNCGIFRWLCIQLNSILFWCKGTNANEANVERELQTNNYKRKWRQQDSQRKRSGVEVHFWKFAADIQLTFFHATTGSKNYMICKIHVSHIFLTDWAESRRSAITHEQQLVQSDRRWNSLEHNVWHVHCREALYFYKQSPT